MVPNKHVLYFPLTDYAIFSWLYHIFSLPKMDHENLEPHSNFGWWRAVVEFLIPRLWSSNFSPQICFWWLRGLSFRLLEDSGQRKTKTTRWAKRADRYNLKLGAPIDGLRHGSIYVRSFGETTWYPCGLLTWVIGRDQKEWLIVHAWSVTWKLKNKQPRKGDSFGNHHFQVPS